MLLSSVPPTLLNELHELQGKLWPADEASSFPSVAEEQGTHKGDDKHAAHETGDKQKEKGTCVTISCKQLQVGRLTAARSCCSSYLPD